MEMNPDTGMTIDELTVYSSPRYFRLIFPDLKPRTKNGDLVSALGELKRWKYLTLRSHWDKIILTEKGQQYKSLIKHFLDMGALNVPQADGLFDYRSEGGRKAIIELIQFLATKLDFNKYINYLHLPIFESENNPEWMEIFGKQGEPKIDYDSPEGRDQLIQYLQNRNRPFQKQTEALHDSMITQETPVVLNQTLVKKFLKRHGMSRPTPLFNHFNSAIPRIFQIRDRKFYVNLSELTKMNNLLTEHLIDFETNENQWLTDYFKLLKLPTGKSGLFGFMAGEEIQYATKSDAFLNLAIEGPRIFAGQFSAIEPLGELRQIMFPINPKESLIIACDNLDMLYYFTIESKKCSFKATENLLSLKKFPEKYITSRGNNFGELISRSRTLDEAVTIQSLYQTNDTRKKRQLKEQLKEMRSRLEQQMSHLSYMSASLISICQMITMKYNSGFGLTKCLCFFTNGYINLVDVGGMDRIMTSINLAKIDYGKPLKRAIRKIEKSLEEIMEIDITSG